MANNELSPHQIEKLIVFRDGTDVPVLNRNLRNVLLQYVAEQRYYDFDRGDFIIEMVKLFDLLDALQ